MELVTKKRLHLVSGRANLPLAQEIAERLGVELGDANLAEFANGELHTRFGESVRGTDVFIIQTHVSTSEMSVNDAIMEQLIMVDAAKRAFPLWSGLPAAERSRWLLRLADAVEARANELAREESLDAGKPLAVVLEERVMVPTKDMVLRAGDEVVALITEDAEAAVTKILVG